jgi:hypothetical protein
LVTIEVVNDTENIQPFDCIFNIYADSPDIDGMISFNYATVQRCDW